MKTLALSIYQFTEVTTVVWLLSSGKGQSNTQAPCPPEGVDLFIRIHVYFL